MNEINTEKKIVKCYQCNKELDFLRGDKIMRRDTCSHCFAELRCCKMCKYYDPSAYNECREPIADRILEKSKANFCEYFFFTNPEHSEDRPKEDLFKAAESLLKKSND